MFVDILSRSRVCLIKAGRDTRLFYKAEMAYYELTLSGLTASEMQIVGELMRYIPENAIIQNDTHPGEASMGIVQYKVKNK